MMRVALQCSQYRLLLILSLCCNVIVTARPCVGTLLFAHQPRPDKNEEALAPSSRQRREFVSKILASSASVLVGTASVAHAETVGKDENCQDSSCLGVWDGLLADCPHGKLDMKSGAGCVSSQDDTPGVFAEPWDYSEAPNDSMDYQDQMRLLRPSIELVCSKRGDSVQNLVEDGRYLRVIFTDNKTKEKSVGEFYFTPNDSTVQFRIGTLTPGGGSAGFISASLKNIERAEMIRKQCRYTKIPVLRNRRRSFVFGESGECANRYQPLNLGCLVVCVVYVYLFRFDSNPSKSYPLLTNTLFTDLDSFGPSGNALGPPADMADGEMEGRLEFDEKRDLRIDFLQSPQAPLPLKLN